MIFDFSIADRVSNLGDYYTELYSLHANTHRPEYMLVHDEIIERVNECESYTELGVNQGATLAAALLQNPKRVRAYDIKLKPYNFAKHLFEGYIQENNIDYAIYETDSLICAIEPVDVLYIDTLHKHDHLRKELTRHGDKAKRYIILHDTAAQKGLKRAAKEYVEQNKHWKIERVCDINVGFMTLKRID